MGVLLEEIPDVVKSFVNDRRQQTYVDASRNRQHSIFAQHFVSNPVVEQRKKKAVTYEERYNVGTRNSNRWKNIDSPDSLSRGNNIEKAQLNMAFTDCHMVVNTLEPCWMQPGAEEALNYLDVEYSNMFDRFFEFMDDIMFVLPTAPNTTTPSMWTIPYYVVPGSGTDFAFGGGNPSGYSAVAGINRSLTKYTKLKNGTGKFTSVDQFDFCKIAAEAFQKCQFRPYYSVGKGRAKEDVAEARFRFYSDYTLYQEYQDINYTSHDNVGPDQGEFRKGGRGGDNVFMSSSWSWVPDRVDESGTEVATIGTRYFYGLDLSTWQLHPYGDVFMKEMKDLRVTDNHNELAQFMDTGIQMFCRNPRCNFVLIPA